MYLLACQFCTYSQCLLIALKECSISTEITFIAPHQPPDW